jgi:hypothetical protein
VLGAILPYASTCSETLCLVEISGKDTEYNEDFHGFPQSLQSNAALRVWKGPDFLLPHGFKLIAHQSLYHLTRYSKLLAYVRTHCSLFFSHAAWKLYIYILGYRPVPKQSLCKQRPLLGNARNIHPRNNRMTGLCNQFQSNGLVNTPTAIVLLLETVFYIGSVQSGCKEEFSWELAVEFRSSMLAVSRELGRWSWEFRCGMLTSGQRRDHASWSISLGRSRCQETASGNCNRLRTLVCVCQWSVKCSFEECIQVVNKSNSSNPYPVYSHTPLNTWEYIVQ